MDGQGGPQRDDLRSNGCPLDIPENDGAGPQELHRGQVVGLAERVRRDQLQAECQPAPHFAQRKDGGQCGNLPDVFKAHDHIDLREFHTDLKPGSQFFKGYGGQDSGRRSEVFQRHVGIQIGHLEGNRQDCGLRVLSFDDTEHQRAVLEILEGRCTGGFSESNTEVEPRRNLRQPGPAFEVRHRLDRRARGFRRQVPKLVEQGHQRRRLTTSLLEARDKLCRRRPAKLIGQAADQGI